MNNLVTILLSGGLSAVLASAVVFLLRNWISERIKLSIQHEYNEKSKAIDFAHDQKLKAIEFEYNQQLEKLRVELQGQSANTSTKLAAELEHDRQVFNRLNSIVDEVTFRDVCNVIADCGFYDYEPFHKVVSLRHHGGQVENQFLNTVLQNDFSKLIHTLSTFTAIVAVNFFSTSENRYMIYPALKDHPPFSEKRQRFDKAFDNTRVAADNVLAAYAQYRQQVKTVLFI